MNILVCIKQVPDTTEIRMDPKTNTLIRAGVPSTVNPFDKYALEAAVQLRETLGGTVTAMTMGPAQAAQALRECYALGADRMVLVSDRRFGGADTYATSYTLAQAVRALVSESGCSQSELEQAIAVLNEKHAEAEEYDLYDPYG